MKHLDPEQIRAIDAAGRFMHSDQQILYIAGPAGVGKTTIALEVAKLVGSGVVFGAATGKAASVLDRKGCTGAKTIHQLFFTPSQKSATRLTDLTNRLAELTGILEKRPNNPEAKRNVETLTRAVRDEKRDVGRPMFTLNLGAEAAHAPLVILDEVSMVGERMAADILSLAKKLIVFGDPYQLPPVRESGYFTHRKPDVLLEKVHRQGADSPILDLATKIRRGRGYSRGEYGPLRILSIDDERCQELCLGADQMIVGRNATRMAANRKHRELRGFETRLPEAGDRVICRKNNHELGLLNGTIWNVSSVDGLRDDDKIIDLTIDPVDDPTRGRLQIEATTEMFLGGEKPTFVRKGDPECFDFGYAITCHAAQGSEWDDVYVLDESQSFGRNVASRWLYTAVTRAAKSLTLVIP